GVWRRLTDGSGGGAYDVERRTLAWRKAAGDGRVQTLDLGVLLDRRAAPRSNPRASAPIAAVPNEVWLRYQAESADKVWFARLDAASFTVRFGTRGGPLQEKKAAFQTRALAQTKYRAVVQEKLAKGYEHAPEGEAIAKLPGLRAWHVGGKTRSKD